MHKWWGLGLAALSVAASAAWWLHHQRQVEEAAHRAHYQALQAQKDYRSEALGCTLTFPTGYAHRVTAYDPFEFRQQRAAELATSNDTSDGETWAEFYTLPSADVVQTWLQGAAWADESHRLVRQRLVALFQLGLPSETDAFKGRWQTLAQGEKNGWQVRGAYLPTPYGAAEFSAQQVPRTELKPADVVAEMPLFGMPSDRTSPWVWLGVDDFRHQAERDAFRRAERQALAHLKQQADEYQRERERFLNRHRHFYLVEAVKALGPTQVVVVRRFGSVVHATTPRYGAEVIEKMMASVQCDAARP